MQKCSLLLCLTIVFLVGQPTGRTESFEHLVKKGSPSIRVFFKESEVQINGPKPLSLEDGEKELRRLLETFSPDLPVCLICPETPPAHTLIRWLQICSEYPESYARIFFLPEYDWDRTDNLLQAKQFDISIANPR